ncbi:MAG: hypothetical protein HOV94_06215, partial [Saccharothrix sp.]|nr:hypothetical protein [Saccharothrix sp.]
VVWTAVAMAVIALAGAAVADVDGPAAGGLVVGSLSVVVDLVLVRVALHRPHSTVRQPMRTTHPRAVRRAATGAAAALLMLAVVITVAGCDLVGDRSTGTNPTVTVTAVDTAGVVIRG